MLKVLFNDMELYNLKGTIKIAEQELTVNQTTFELIDTPFTFNATYKPVSAHRRYLILI